MFCYRCNNQAGSADVCPNCGADLKYFQMARKLSNQLYNEGLQKASLRNLSGAISSLKRSLKFNKYNIDARNLLGLCYLEVGETVNALSEWIVSVSYMGEDNRASYYLEEVQNNKSRLDAVNQTIKKYNQALLYCKQDSRDLAIIQLKKVLGLNPKLVKAYQLLALLYMQEGKLEQAKKTLRSAGKIDMDNLTTLRYMKEVNHRIKQEKPNRTNASDDLVTYQSGNETIIMPKRFRETSFGATIIALIGGIAIGVLIFAFLVVPSVKRKAQSDAKAQLVEANDTISQNSQMITTLNNQIAELQEQLAASADTNTALEGKTSAYDNLTLAYSSYVAGDILQAGTYLAAVNRDSLSETGAAAYDALNNSVSGQYMEEAYNQGISQYNNGDFAGAVGTLKTVYDKDPSYMDGQTAYYLAQALRQADDYEGAKPYYQYVVDNYEGTNIARTAQRYLE